MVSLNVFDEGDKNTIDRFLSILLNLRIVAGWEGFIGSSGLEKGMREQCRVGDHSLFKPY